MTDSTPKLLVVGGHGFIGRHVVAHAVGLGWSVTDLSLNPVADTASGVRHVAADGAQAGALAHALGATDFDYVVNCGGYIDHTAFSQGGRKVFDVHLHSVMNLAEILKRDTLRAFVNIGSSDEYGGNPAPQSEEQRESPISPYSAGKAAATQFLQMLHRTESFPASTLRLFLTYGPGQDARRFLPQLILGCLRDVEFPVSAGEQLRDFCHVQDVVLAIFAAFTKPAAAGEVINIASGQPVSIRHVIETVTRLVGRGRPQFGRIAYRRGENMALYANVAKAAAVLSWQPAIGLEAGLTDVIRSFRSAP